MWLLLLFYRRCRHRRGTSYAKALKICKAIVILYSAWLLLFSLFRLLCSLFFFILSFFLANDLASCCYQHRWIKLNEKYITRCSIESLPAHSFWPLLTAPCSLRRLDVNCDCTDDSYRYAPKAINLICHIHSTHTLNPPASSTVCLSVSLSARLLACQSNTFVQSASQYL